MIAITAKDAAGRSVAISTEVAGVDVTQQPMLLAIGEQKFIIDKVRQIRR
jgi:hypothetical protein